MYKEGEGMVLESPYRVGQKIKFSEEKQRYTIQAMNERYLVCTKPFNLMKSYKYPNRSTVMCTLVDLIEKVRGTEDLIFCMGFETMQDCQECLDRLVAGKSGISYRNRIPLHIE